MTVTRESQGVASFESRGCDSKHVAPSQLDVPGLKELLRLSYRNKGAQNLQPMLV